MSVPHHRRRPASDSLTARLLQRLHAVGAVQTKALVRPCVGAARNGRVETELRLLHPRCAPRLPRPTGDREHLPWRFGDDGLAAIGKPELSAKDFQQRLGFTESLFDRILIGGALVLAT